MFAAPDMEKKHLVKLQLSLRQMFARQPMSPDDSLLIIPLPNEQAKETEVMGNNSIHTVLLEKVLKIML